MSLVLCFYTNLDGKLASPRTISSPCPILARTYSNSGEIFEGIPLRRPIAFFQTNCHNTAYRLQ